MQAVLAKYLRVHQKAPGTEFFVPRSDVEINEGNNFGDRPHTVALTDNRQQMKARWAGTIWRGNISMYYDDPVGRQKFKIQCDESLCEQEFWRHESSASCTTSS